MEKTLSEIWQDTEIIPIIDQARNVLRTGVAYHGMNWRVETMVEGMSRPKFYNYSFTPIKDASETVFGVMHTVTDVTNLAEANQKIEESAYRYHQLIEESPVPTCVFIGREMIIEVANAKMIEVWGRGTSVIGKNYPRSVART